MKTGMRTQKIALILLAAGFTLYGCGQRNPLGIVAEQRGDPPWVKRDAEGHVRSIGRPALGPREDSTQIRESQGQYSAPWVQRDGQAVGRPAPGPRGDEQATPVDRPKRRREGTP